MPSTNYYYLRDGERTGPVAFEELKSLADSGVVAPGDVVWQEGTPDWVPASSIEGLFSHEAVIAQSVAESVAAGVAERMAGSFGGPPPGGDDWRQWTSGLEPQIRRFAGQLNVDRVTLLAAAVGAGTLGLLLLAMLLKWDKASLTDGSFPIYHRGIHVREGKVMILLILSSGGLLAVSLAMVRFLPIGILYAGAAASCSFLLLAAWRIQVPNEIAEHVAFGGTGGATFGLYFAMLLAIVAAGAFIVAALRTPLQLPQFERAGGGPLVQRFGALAISQMVAFLAGMGFVVARL